MPTMNDLTISERLFEQFCKENGIKCNRIGERERKTPDYEVKFGDHVVIAEVKQFDSIRSDLKAFDELYSHSRAVMWKEPGRRVRSKIEDSKRRLKLKSQGRYPTVLVLYDNAVLPWIDWDDFRIAMYGLDSEILDVPPDTDREPIVVATRSGFKAKFTPDRNTTFSALSLLYKSDDGRLNLMLLHNFYAKNPIDPSWFRRATVKHLRLDPTNRKTYPKWVEI